MVPAGGAGGEARLPRRQGTCTAYWPRHEIPRSLGAWSVPCSTRAQTKSSHPPGSERAPLAEPGSALGEVHRGVDEDSRVVAVKEIRARSARDLAQVRGFSRRVPKHGVQKRELAQVRGFSRRVPKVKWGKHPVDVLEILLCSSRLRPELVVPKSFHKGKARLLLFVFFFNSIFLEALPVDGSRCFFFRNLVTRGSSLSAHPIHPRAASHGARASPPTPACSGSFQVCREAGSRRCGTRAPRCVGSVQGRDAGGDAAHREERGRHLPPARPPATLSNSKQL